MATEETMWVALDGQRFSNKDEAERHDRRLGWENFFMVNMEGLSPRTVTIAMNCLRLHAIRKLAELVEAPPVARDKELVQRVDVEA